MTRTPTAQLDQRAQRVTPGGVHSNIRLPGPRVFLDHAAGPRLWDVNGREYVDYLLGQGPNFLGHSPAPIRQAVNDACRRGLLFGGQHRLEVEASEAIADALSWADMVRLGVSGTESVQAALRLARAVTGRGKVIRFQGHYHGWLDNTLMACDADGQWGPASAGQLPQALADQILLPWNEPAAVNQAFTDHGDTIAAVITEPMMINAGAIQPRPGYLQLLRDLCDRHSSVLIFDEVITGFRLALGGAAERFGVAPDLAVYGKALAAGWPVSALAGKAALMSEFGTGRVNHSGTFNGGVMAAAAARATVSTLRADPPYARIGEIGQQLHTGFAKIAAAQGEDLHVQGLPMAFHLGFGPSNLDIHNYDGLARLDQDRYARFAAQLVEHGLWVAGRGIWYVSAVHGTAEVNDTLDRFAAALEALAGTSA